MNKSDITLALGGGEGICIHLREQTNETITERDKRWLVFCDNRRAQLWQSLRNLYLS